MKKQAFWMAMFAVSILNGVCFYGGSANAMNRGLDGVDNQAGLLFIPLFWAAAVFVLIVINLYTLARGFRIEKNQRIGLFDVFRLSGLSGKAKAGRIAFLVVTCLLMVFGFALFPGELAWAAAYALTGGALLLFLYAWHNVPLRA